MKNSALLSRLGLAPTAQTVYLTLLSLGSGSISEIAKKTSLHRPAIYAVIPELLEKKLIATSYLGKRKIYFAESPERLRQLVRDLQTDLEAGLPEFLESYSASTQKPVIKFFEGKQGIRAVYEDLLSSCKKGDIFYRYESPRNYKEMKQYVPQAYRDRFQDKGEVDRLIITNEAVSKMKRPRLGRIIKVVPAKYDLFSYNISQFIYPNKVAFIDFTAKTASLIESPTFAEFQKKIFRLLFDKLWSRC